MSYTARPVSGSATADTSAVVRIWQFGSFCQRGFGIQAEQPLPDPAQADSAQPRPVVVRVSVVPPTATTVLSTAGNWAAVKPKSPEDTVIATPGWL